MYRFSDFAAAFFLLFFVLVWNNPQELGEWIFEIKTIVEQEQKKADTSHD